MTWVRIDDSFPEHPKVARAGGDAAWLYVCGLAYCNRNLTDGVIPASQVARLSDRKNPSALARRLLEVGLWEEHADGYMVHDYLSFQSSRQKVHAERDAAKERMRSRRVRANKDGSSGEVQLPHPIPSQELQTDDDSKVAVPDPPSSSSSDFDRWALDVSTIAARKLAERDSNIRNPDAWVARVRLGIREERADRLREAWQRPDLSLHAAAEWVLTDPVFAADHRDPTAGARQFGTSIALEHVATDTADVDSFAAEVAGMGAPDEWQQAALAAYRDVLEHPSNQPPTLRLVQGD